MFSCAGAVDVAGATEVAGALNSNEAGEGAGAGGNEISNSFSSNTELSHDVFSELVSSFSPLNDSLFPSLCLTMAACLSFSLVSFSSVSFAVT